MEPYILFCRIGWANYYKGDLDDLPQGAGNYDGVEFECYNFLKSNNLYYGFVQVNGNMNLERIGNNAHDGQIDDVLVIFFHKGLIVGWYRHATVYAALQIIPDNVTNRTNFPQHNLYNIVASEAHLIQANERNSYPINFFDGKRPGRQNIWYADEAPGARESAITIVETYDMNHAEELINEEFSDIENESNHFIGETRLAYVKVRINQGRYREKLLQKYNSHCCLCGISNPKLLIASHLKAWADSDVNERVNVNNGLLLCPDHDKLVDKYLISFEDDGRLLISPALSEEERNLMRINENMRLDISAENIPFIQAHREKYNQNNI